MTDASMLALASTGLAATALASAAALRGWNGWLEIRRLEVEAGRRRGGPPDLGEFRRRIRRLEAIADGRE